MATYENGIHFLEAAISKFYRIRRDEIFAKIGEEYSQPVETQEQAEFRDKVVKVLQEDLTTLENTRMEAHKIFHLLETGRLRNEHENDYAKRIIKWLEDNLPEGGFLKR